MPCRFSNDHLRHLADLYRYNASEQAKMSWPKKHKEYRQAQTDMAELIEELLAFREKLA